MELKCRWKMDPFFKYFLNCQIRKMLLDGSDEVAADNQYLEVTRMLDEVTEVIIFEENRLFAHAVDVASDDFQVLNPKAHLTSVGSNYDMFVGFCALASAYIKLAEGDPEIMKKLCDIVEDCRKSLGTLETFGSWLWKSSNYPYARSHLKKLPLSWLVKNLDMYWTTKAMARSSV